MKESKNLNDLIDALTILPGIGRKSAQRMAYKLIRSNKEKTLNLSDKLANITNNTFIINSYFINSCGRY